MNDDAEHREADLPPMARGPDRDLFGRAPRNAPDWSHRRGEPRWFALAWTMFVLLTTIGALQAAGGLSANAGPTGYRPSARLLMAALGGGMAIIWPLFRLSQLSPSGGRFGAMRDAARDWVVVQVPLQAVVLPHLLLARWSAPVIGALGLSFAVWGWVIAAIIAIALGGRDRTAPHRSSGAWAMVACLAVAVLTPLLAAPSLPWVGVDAVFPTWWWMLSPIAAGPEITRDREWTGHHAAVFLEHWQALAAVGGAAAVLWLIALGLALAQRRGRG